MSAFLIYYVVIKSNLLILYQCVFTPTGLMISIHQLLTTNRMRSGIQ